ncbi:hypothetical protein Syun_006322 [Stephania yunnanensis]|uniref:Uncharacterized protein n=1 Tax=Stephania yunnanensis TaxID=152371 RepID=A0AAP0KWG8_9MAGN
MIQTLILINFLPQSLSLAYNCPAFLWLMFHLQLAGLCLPLDLFDFVLIRESSSFWS